MIQPDVCTLFSNLPTLLDEPFDVDEVQRRVIAQAKAHMECELKPEKPHKSPGYIFLDWYFEHVYFVPVGEPLNPTNLVCRVLLCDSSFNDSDSTRIEGELSIGNMTCTELFRLLQSWLTQETISRDSFRTLNGAGDMPFCKS